ncbi:MAG TPA: hypothetical protein VKV40_07755 [Ktedonobacteraceae bacterium]|nr:hypothetical protein [Ktedonobacteraceae bacterium]
MPSRLGEANIDIANEGSKGLLLKPGFAYEGILRERSNVRDRFEYERRSKSCVQRENSQSVRA